MLQCQEFVNDCKFQGTSITPFECCNMFFQPLIGTQNGGLCWLFNHNNTISQSALDLSKGLELVFSIAHNSFSNFLHKHPGIDVYLVDGNLEALRLATESFDSITLKDKQGVRLRMHKEYETDLRRFECGATSSSAKAVDSKGVNSQGSAYVLCLLQTILRVCECLPLFVSYIQYNTHIYSVLQYEQCAKSYMEYVKPIHWNEELSSRLGVTFRQNVDNCRRNFRPCQKTLFHGPIDYYDLPVELTQNTQDFITKLTVVYESLMVTDTIRTRSPSFYELLSYIGYNIALWFAIGHIIWSIIITPCNWFCQSNSKVGPTNLSISTVKNPSPVVTLGNPNRQQLAPIDANTSSQELFPEQI
uniref:Uncharacterized protein n=1 Tax=Acrobeloides nanus TaxID=290746 RepID=A0A914BZD2_9BILA